MAKHHRYFLIIFTALFMAISLNCGSKEKAGDEVKTFKNEKEQALYIAKSFYDFFMSDEYVEILKKGMKEDGSEAEKAVQEKLDEIAKKAGFKNMDEADQFMSKFENDPEINALGEKIEKRLDEISASLFN